MWYFITGLLIPYKLSKFFFEMFYFMLDVFRLIESNHFMKQLWNDRFWSSYVVANDLMF